MTRNRWSALALGKHFFAAANDTPANTRLTVTFGGRCFAHAANKITP